MATPCIKSSQNLFTAPAHRQCLSPRPALRVLPKRNVQCNAESFRVASPWQRYCFALETNPVRTKAATSLVGFMLGDILAQLIEGHGAIDPMRMARLGLYGLMLDGPIGHLWYKWLDGTCDKTFDDPKGTKAVLTKTAADQLVWAPVMTVAFFAVLKLLEGHPELALETVQEKTLPTMVANYALWPLAHMVSFKFVPGEQRVLYNNAIAIFWNAYLSMTAVSTGVPDIDPTMLPALSEISARISASIPVHHFWLTDLFSSIGINTSAVTFGVNQIAMAEQAFLFCLIKSAEQFQSAPAAQVSMDMMLLLTACASGLRK